MVDDFYGSGYTQNADHISVPSLKWLAIKVDLTKYTKIIADYSTTTGSNSESWDCLGVLNGNVNITSADNVQANAVEKSLTKGTSAQNYVNKEIDVSGLSGEYIVALGCYGKALTVTKLQIL